MDWRLWLFREVDALIRAARRWAYRRLYLRSAHWKRTHLAAIRRAGGKCADCGRRDHLDVHHLSYARIGHEMPGDLQVLCRWCHTERHALKMALGTTEVA